MHVQTSLKSSLSIKDASRERCYLKRILFRYMIISFSVILLTACAQTPQISKSSDAAQSALSWQEQYDLGMKYLAERNYSEAIVAFTLAIEIDPKQAYAYVGRGDAYVGLAEMKGDENESESLEKAASDYSSAIELEPENVDTYIKRGDVYVMLSELAENMFDYLQKAIEDFNTAINLNPDLADVYIRRGNAYMRMDETEENLTAAKVDYEKALELDETLAEGYLGLADVFLRQREYERTESTLQDGLEKSLNTHDIEQKLAEIEKGLYTDSSGKTHRTNRYDSNGNLVHYFESQYDSQGRETSSWSYDITSNGEWELNGYYEYIYGDNGLAERMNYYRGDGSLLSYDLYQYDQSGNRVRDDQHFTTPAMIGSYETNLRYFIYEYDDDGKHVKTSEYVEGDQLIRYHIPVYDSRGYEIRSDSYNALGELDFYNTYEYDNDGKRVSSTSYDANGGLIAHYVDE